MNIFKIPLMGLLSQLIPVRFIVTPVLGSLTLPALLLTLLGSLCVRRGVHATSVAEKEPAVYFPHRLPGYRDALSVPREPVGIARAIAHEVESATAPKLLGVFPKAI